MCIYLRYISKDVDIVFFYVGGSDLLLPILYAKILKKEVITSAIGRNSLGIKYSTVRGNNLNKLKYVIFTILEELTFLFSDKIMVESFNAISFLKLNKYSDKIFYKGARFIDINEFYIKNDILDRQNIIGYIGRLNEEKGILNLLKSILILSEMYTDISFKIVGNGPLYPYVINFLKEKKLFNKRVIVYGWVPNEKIPDYLNEIKFLILPSYSEGLPTIILEAMACGTIVISSPVGAIPDIIKDGKSGFLMDDNKPDTIVNTFIKVKDNLNLRNISQYSHILIESEYSYKAAILRYKKLLNI
jgi:glycosyltransferase involved in cell wall biosynthesis